MSVTIAGTTFDSHEYDDRGDVLYLAWGLRAGRRERLRRPKGTPSTTTSRLR
jgi:hypothetical protein